MHKDVLEGLSERGTREEECLVIMVCGDVSVAVGTTFLVCVKCLALLLVEFPAHSSGQEG